MRKLYFLIFIVLFLPNVKAQTINYDYSFNTQYQKYGNGIGPNDEVRFMLPLQGNKLLLGGNFTHYNGTKANRLVSIEEGGAYSTDIATGEGFDKLVKTAAIQDDNKIVIGGDFDFYDGNIAKKIVRIHPSGDYDEDFRASINGSVHSIAIQQDGRIIVAGNFTIVNDEVHSYIVRLNTDGSVDHSFVTNTVNNYINSLLITQTNHIYIAGKFNEVNLIQNTGIARLNENGELDDIFKAPVGISGEVFNIAEQIDGKLILVGDFNSYDNIPRNNIVRIERDGDIDHTFDPITGANKPIYSLKIQQDDNILIGGSFDDFNSSTFHQICRLTPDGRVDINFAPGEAFNPQNIIVKPTVYAFYLNTNNDIYVGGFFTKYNLNIKSCLVKINSFGAFDAEFNPHNGANGTVYKAIKLNNDEYLIGGNFTNYNNRLERNYLMKLHENGLPNDAFVSSFDGIVRDFIVEPSGYIVAVGDFTKCNNSNAGGIVRISSTGTVDSSFNSFVGFNVGSTIKTIMQLDNGKYIVVGEFNTYNGKPIGRIALINFDGTLDTINFNPGNSANAIINTIALQKDGKFIIGGEFSFYRSIAAKGMARIHPNGSIDNSFFVGNGFNKPVAKILIDTADKIIAVGDFTTYRLLPKSGICRLNPDASVDTNFVIGLGSNNSINAIAINTDSKLLVGGNFTTFNGKNTNRLARLNYNGSVDSTFTMANGSDSTIYSILLEPKGDIFVTGSFEKIANEFIVGVARLLGDRKITLNPISGSICAGNKIAISYNAFGSFTSNNNFVAQLSNEFGSFENPTDIGLINSNTSNSFFATIPVNAVVGSNYKIRLVSTQPYLESNDNGSNLSIDICPSIFIDSLVTTSFCQGENITITFNTLGTFNSNNEFNIELSDSNGSFASATLLTTIADTIGSTINSNIPTGLVGSSNYQIRIVSTSPVITSFNDSQTVTIKNNPTANITVSGFSDFCPGDSSKIDAITSTDVQKVQWLYNGSPTSVNDTLLFYYGTKPGLYSYEAFGNTGCNATSQSVGLNFVQYNLALINSNKLSSCFNNNEIMFYDQTVSLTVKDRLWVYDGQFKFDSAITANFTSVGKHTVKFYIRYTDGCIDSASSEITIHPQTNVVLDVDKTSSCQNNNQFEFNDLSTLSSGTYFRLWDMGDQNYYSTQQVSKSYNTFGSYVVKLKTVTAFGCLDSAEKIISVYAKPKAEIGYIATTPCLENNYFQLFDLSSIPNGFVDHITWYLPNYPPTTKNSLNFSFFKEGLNEVKIVAVSGLGCVDSTTTYINVMANLPKPTIGYNNGKLVSSSADNYQWFRNNILITDSISQTYTPTSPGSYLVKVGGANNCTRMSEPFLINVVGLGDELVKQKITFYPNPTNGMVTINYDKNATITVTDINGRHLLTTAFMAESPQIDLSNLNTGIYFLTISNNQVNYTHKIIKQ